MSNALVNKVKLNSLTSVRQFGAKGDGVSDDTAALQAALDSGEVLLWEAGVYITTSTLLITNDNTHLVGYGVTIKHTGAIPASPGYGVSGSVIYAEGLDNVCVEGFEIDGTKATKTFGTGTSYTNGIEYYGCTNSRIINNYVHDCYEHGIRIGQFTSNPAVTNTMVVTGNICVDNGNVINDRGWGIWTFGQINNITVNNNICRDNQTGGIMCDDGSTGGVPGQDGYAINISNNVVTDIKTAIGATATSSGVQIDGATYGIISNNIINGYENAISNSCGQAGTVTGNTVISGNVARGLRRAITSAATKRTNIIGNRLTVDDAVSADACIELYTPTYATEEVQEVVISNNIMYSTVTGVLIGESSLNVTDNQNVHVRDNVIRHTGSAATTGHWGVYVAESNNTRILNNTVLAFYDGIVVEAAADNTWIKGNTVSSCESYGIRLAEPTKVLANTCSSNTLADIRTVTGANTADTLFKDNELLSTTTTSGPISSTVRQNNYPTI
jgi:parallel beta-helix repeat protein